MPRKPPKKNSPSAAEPIPGVNPAVEDHLTPDDSQPFPIVAVGASAGGLDAYRRFLEALPQTTGMAFVAIQHLHPGHHSLLPDILSRSTKLPVRQVENNMRVEPNHVYVMPPGKSMVLGNGALQLTPRTEEHGLHHPIDHFMRSLAEERGHSAIGIVLSGTGADGTLGVQEIKASGGITFAQDESAEQSAMPRSAVASGSVDFVLPPEKIAREIGRIAQHPFITPQGDTLHRDMPRNDPTLQRALEIVRREMGVDFLSYKRSTVQRRVLRRMVLNKVGNLHDYVDFLQQHPNEVEALYADLLINVTSFFRNPDAYEWIKENVFPRMAEGRSRHEPLRIWALGCSTGEEAYSLAMAFTEFIETSGKRAALQIFASDLNGAGIEKARTGLYSRGIEQDVSPERLRRFFTEVDGSYRIAKPIRDMCVFARQNVLTDPPFSRIDLVACRNLLIYLEPIMQQRLLRVVHYALHAEGFLWLGSAESAGSAKDLFEVESAKVKVYRRRPGPPATVEVVRERHRAPPTRLPQPHPIATEQEAPPQHGSDEADRLLLTRYAPATVIVDADGEIVQFRGDTGPYLSAPTGRATRNLLKMLRSGLLEPVEAALGRAKRERRAIREEGVRVKTEKGLRRLNLVVVPLHGEADAGKVAVIFEEPGLVVAEQAEQRKVDLKAGTGRKPTARETPAKRIERLERELESTRHFLQTLNEEHEAANEELQAANEEIQSTNEELQSVNEELETSQEELQSSNEELATVNDELASRNDELARANTDLFSLLSSVEMPIVLLDWDLRIRRFTPSAEKFLHLLSTDIGRPVTDIKLPVDVPDVEALFGQVLDAPTGFDREARDRHGRWWSMRIRQYRTGRNKVEGIVLMFVDIDAMKRASDALRESDARFEVLADNAPVLIWVDDKSGRQFVNRAFEEFTGLPESALLKSGWTAIIHSDDREAFLAAYREGTDTRRPFEATCRFRRGDGLYRWMRSTAIPRIVADEFVGYVGCSVDVTELKEADATLRQADRAKDEFLGMLAHELRNPLAAMSNAAFLVADAKATGPTVASALGIIDRQMRNMTRIVDDLLDVSRITHGKIQLRSEPVNLETAVRNVVNSSSHERTRLQQKLVVETSEVWVEADPARIDQILDNLLGNASKFTPEGGHLRLTLEKEGRSAVIRMRDDGIGMEATNLERVFDLFVQAADGGPRRSSGVGIGLALVRKLVELHGGTIEAFSAGPGKGSDLVVRLPLVDAPADRDPAPDAPPSTQARRVLVVDDNRDGAESLGTLVRQSGHEMRVAHDGASAVRIALDFDPHIVLLDIGLPDIDGYSVAQRLRTEGGAKDALIVALTGYGRAEDIERAREAGFDEHLTKPADPRELLRLIGSKRED